MSGYTKLFSSILTSSVWGEADHTRIVWITLLALADRNGDVSASVGGLARSANLDRERCEEAIKVLSSPDPDDRSGVKDGIRIEPIQGGWHIVNYAVYREKMRAVDRTEYLRKKKRESRAKKSTDVNTSTNVNQSQPIADTASTASTEAREEKTPTPSAPLLDLDLPEEKATTVKTLTPQQAFIDSSWKTYDDVGAMRPPAALLAKWARDYFKGNYAWMLRSLAEMAPRGALSKGDAYVGTALKNIAEGKSFAPAKPVDERQWVPVGTLDEDL